MNKRGENRRVVVFLCDIRSAHNAGAIMRTADAIAASEIVFGGYTPGPLDRFGRVRKDFAKASLGAEKSLGWRFAPNVIRELSLLKKQGAYAVALEQSKKSVDYKKIRLPNKPIVVIFGNEVSGLPPKVQKLADAVAEIPMRGKKESLNVSVAAGIVLYRLFDR